MQKMAVPIPKATLSLLNHVGLRTIVTARRGKDGWRFDLGRCRVDPSEPPSGRDRDAHQLDPGIGVEEATNLEERHRGEVFPEVPAITLTDGGSGR